MGIKLGVQNFLMLQQEYIWPQKYFKIIVVQIIAIQRMNHLHNNNA